MSKELSPDSKFTISIQTGIMLATGIASLVGMWYVLQADIQEAKELPVPVSLFSEEYPSKGIKEFNWSPSYEQYKQQISQLQNDVDQLYETVEGLQEDNDKLNQQIINLRIAVQ
jgi:TolA-binding protein